MASGVHSGRRLVVKWSANPNGIVASPPSSWREGSFNNSAVATWLASRLLIEASPQVRSRCLRPARTAEQWVVQADTFDQRISKDEPMRFQLLLLAGMLMAAGCAGGKDQWEKDRRQVVEAGGVVTFDGAPLPGATVIFSPAGGLSAAVGRTDAEGRFVLKTYADGDGAIATDHKVTVTCVKVEGPPPGANLDEIDPTIKETSLIPERYGQADKSGLTATVTYEGPNEFKFELTK